MPADRSTSSVIVGAGIGGPAAAIELRRHGYDDPSEFDFVPKLGQR